jgi:hypothetical protein
VPDLGQLATKYRARGLGMIGVYHRKGTRLSDAAIRATYSRLGGPDALAVDEGWRLLRPIMERGRLRRATSISLLVDRAGIVRWVHAGPRIHHASDPRYAGPAQDLRELDALVDALLPSAAPVGR